MSKFHDKPITFREHLESLDNSEISDLVDQVKEWEKKYPNKGLYIEIDHDNSSYGSYVSVWLCGQWTETPEDVEKRRKEYEAFEKLEAKNKYQKQKEAKKRREEEDLKEWNRLQKKFGKKGVTS